MPSNLGVEFWGNFYRVDTDQYTFARMHDEIKSLKLQVELKAEDAAEPTAVAKIRDNLLAVKTHLRKKGFRPHHQLKTSMQYACGIYPRSGRVTLRILSSTSWGAT